MKQFLDDNFLLETKTAERLYHEYAKRMPIIDYHCHLPPQQIAENARFKNITQAWLYGDHYKWRAMRTNGVDEHFVTGGASDEEKFLRWAETVPYTMRNPLYHWTHMELRRYFDIDELLDANSGKKIYEEASARISSEEYSVQNLLRKMNVKVVCTTDDPVDTLEFHRKMKAAQFEIPVYPAFRPDAAMNVSAPETFAAYVAKLEAVSNIEIKDLDTYLQALKNRHDFFAEMGCSVSDHGLEYIEAVDYTEKEISALFDKITGGQALTPAEQEQFRSAMLVWFAEWDHEKGWVQQYHLGALRNNNSRLLAKLGPDTGWDSIGDFPQGRTLSKFLNSLEKKEMLTKTILYNLNPADNELFATMTGNFNDGTVAGKVQWGSGWWFLDQKDGMINQMNTLSNMGLISRFVGMLTDSRSFLSFPRHEYFRRILCNLFGNDIENGELPNDINWIGKIIQDISFNNANEYFGFKVVNS
ncbi:glucuronate isomerase [Niabella ginsenosidivorans]|uniref:Uronate isomerase n=1 Tax=Niabella ginsenosidivorans TaxID=1176587 RepID=A0A1A9I4I5_9BACT|nr:glucuronate isomerase [Niabella ginsenosidivorans]ANH82588.1 glucuronate isomerase [Niabella ginsenosidivorans]